jgi:hypothetical protein
MHQSLRAAKRLRTDLQVLTGKAPVSHACTADTRRCVDARSYLAALRPCCRGHLRQLVADVQQVFGDLGIRWWADYGTLLGAVRNPLTTWADYPWLPQREGPIAPGIIPHDKDADFGALHAEWDKIKRACILLRRKRYHVIQWPGVKVKVRTSRINHTNLDLFLWQQRSDGVMSRAWDGVSHYIPVDAFKGRDFPATWLDPMTTVEWEGLTLPAPTDPAAFCAFRYGSNWMTPVAANHDGVKR